MLSQRPSFRFLATGAVGSLFILTFLLLSIRQSGSSTLYSLKTSQPRPQLHCPSHESANGTWEFVVERDGQDHGLSEEQCRITFPKLFIEIDKSASLKQENHISYTELDSRNVEDSMVRGIIDQGEVSYG
jgi:hypothetical protein